VVDRLPLWPVGGSGELVGRRWIEAAEEAIGLLRRSRIVCLVGRAGMGKTRVLRYIESKLNDYVTFFIDCTELWDRSLGGVARWIAVRGWWSVVELVKKVGGSRGRGCRLVEVFKRGGGWGLAEYASNMPSDFLLELGEVAKAAGFKGVVLLLDELVVSFDDPKAFEAIYALHRLRNVDSDNVRAVATMLPEVFESLLVRDPPLGSVLQHSMVVLPDVPTSDELVEILSYYFPDMGPDRLRLLVNYVVSERPNLTVRDAIFLARKIYENPKLLEKSLGVELTIE